MHSSSTARRPARRSGLLRRVGTFAAVAAVSLAAAGSAQAAKVNVYFSVSVFPANYDWDGVTPLSTTQPPSTGSYYGYVDVNYDPANSPGTDYQQLRGGVVVSHAYDPVLGVYPATSVVPGDVFRIIASDTKAVLAETTFGGNPFVTSSLLGQPAFSGTVAAGTTEVWASLQRRVARTNYNRNYVPGVYTWQPAVKTSPASPDYDDTAQAPDDEDYNLPAKPSLAALLPPNDQYKLTLVTAGHIDVTSYPTNRIETVSVGRVTALTDAGFAGAFGTPIAAGDYLQVTQSSDAYVNDIHTNIVTTITSPGGVVPPRDAVPPKIVSIIFGAKSTSYERYGKAGLRSFVTIDEPGTVTQSLQYTEKAKKGKKKKKKNAIAKVVAPKVVGTGTATATYGGQTVFIDVKSDKKGKKALKSFKKIKGGKLHLVTTVTDLAGNVVVNEQRVKLTN